MLDGKVANLVYVNMVSFVDLGLLISLKSRASFKFTGQVDEKDTRFCGFSSGGGFIFN
jgi:hypothetical protein